MAAARNATKRLKKQVYIPSQERSRNTYECVIRAAARILSKDGIAGFSTNRVSEVSGVAVGSIYQYFKSKEAILEVIAQRHIGDIREAMAAEAAESAMDDNLMGRLIDGALAAHMREPDLHKAISEIPSYPAAYRAITAEKRKLDLEIDRFLRRAIKLVYGVDDDNRARSAALVVYSLVEATIHRAVIGAPGAYDLPRLTTELKRASRLYLESLREGRQA